MCTSLTVICKSPTHSLKEPQQPAVAAPAPPPPPLDDTPQAADQEKVETKPPSLRGLGSTSITPRIQDVGADKENEQEGKGEKEQPKKPEVGLLEQLTKPIPTPTEQLDGKKDEEQEEGEVIGRAEWIEWFPVRSHITKLIRYHTDSDRMITYPALDQSLPWMLCLLEIHLSCSLGVRGLSSPVYPALVPTTYYRMIIMK